MKTLSLTFKMFVATTFMLALCSVAQAVPRTWVSGTGNDANPCTRTLPCATFAAAFALTDAGGEIDAIDAGNYGVIAINKAITIDGGTGNVASILIAGGIGISIAAGVNDAVILRNISLNGRQLGGSIGIHYASGGVVVLDNVTIERFDQGIFAKGFGGMANPLRMEINKCRFYNNLVGIQQEDDTFIAMRDSVITGTRHTGATSFGINMQPAAGTRAAIKLDNNEISYTHSGIRATSTDLGKGAVDIHARNNWVYKNVIGLNVTNAVVLHTAGNNLLSENDFPQAGAPVTVGHFTF